MWKLIICCSTYKVHLKPLAYQHVGLPALPCLLHRETTNTLQFPKSQLSNLFKWRGPGYPDQNAWIDTTCYILNSTGYCFSTIVSSFYIFFPFESGPLIRGSDVVLDSNATSVRKATKLNWTFEDRPCIVSFLFVHFLHCAIWGCPKLIVWPPVV